MIADKYFKSHGKSCVVRVWSASHFPLYPVSIIFFTNIINKLKFFCYEVKYARYVSFLNVLLFVLLSLLRRVRYVLDTLVYLS